MDINAEMHFTQLPSVAIERSKMPVNTNHKTTFDAGKLIPVFVDEILPGSTYSLDVSSIVRMATPVFPVMDDAKLDLYWFFVPNRLVWEHWQDFCGENNTTYWEQPIEYEVPQLAAPEGGWTEGTLADYFRIPTKVDGFTVNALPFRAYAKIWNDWFRDENLKQPCDISLDETQQTGVNTGNYITDVQLGGLPAPVAKFHDFYTSCLPNPQKGQAAGFDLGATFGGTYPVYGNGKAVGLSALANGGNILSFGLYAEKPSSAYASHYLSGATNAFGYSVGDSVTTSGGYGFANGDYAVGVVESGESGLQTSIPDTRIGGQITINELREAFAVQRFLELQARAGSRYVEILRSSFGVISDDARLQRSEYLGGARVDIQMDSVVQTSNSNSDAGTTPQGNVAGYSSTGVRRDAGFTHSFVEHGYLFCLACVRNVNTYQQGLMEMWQRKSKLDFYWPTFAHIGEQPVKNKTIYLQSDTVVDEDGDIVNDQTFGFQEAWASYRFKPSGVSGLMRSNATGTLDSWHYADYYESLPTLSSGWIDSDKANINRTLAVQDENQFIADFNFSGSQVLPMPTYSVPGLIDHF